MVACAAGASVAAIQLLVGQPVIGSSGSCMQQNSSCAIVDQLKQRLQLVIENTDESGAAEVISKLEGLTLTKEVLEITRIGLAVNDIRRHTAQIWPNLSKRCRSLIKTWQKLADIQRPISSCEGSSNGGTPNLVSPSVRRGLTPRTPGGTVGKRITSTDSKCSKNGISPTNGSYAPRKVSPFTTTATQVHKSASVGSSLYSMSVDAVATSSKHSSPESSLPAGADAASFNAAEKRKAEQSVGTMAKRCKTVSNFNQVSPRNGSSNNLINSGAGNAGSVSVVAARKNVQSTAELVAQLTGNLPQNMAIDLNKPEIETQKSTASYSNDSKFTKNDVSPESGISATASGSTLGKTKRKYTKRAAKFFRNSPTMEENGGVVDERTSLVSIAEEQQEQPKKEIKEEVHSKVDNFETQQTKQDDNGDEEAAHPSTLSYSLSRSSNYWLSTVPTLDSLRKNMPVYAEPMENITDSVVIPIRKRQVLLLPYCDIGGPDFLEHNYPDQDKFYATAHRNRPNS